MENDERLLPLPEINNLPLATERAEPTHYAPIYDEEFSETRSIREYWNVIYKRLPIILAMTVLTTAVVAFYMYRQPSVYEASTEMIIEPRKASVQSKDAININFGNDANYYNTQLRLLQSFDLMREVVINLNLQRDPNLFGGQNRGFFSTVRSMFSSEKDGSTDQAALPMLTENNVGNNQPQAALTPEEKDRVDRYAGILLGGLKVTQLEGTNLVTITEQSTNPQLAAKATDAIGKVFIKQDIERASIGDKRTLEDLTKSIEDLKTNIGNQEVELISFMRAQNLPLGAEGTTVSSGILQNLSSQWLSAIDKRRTIEANYTTAQRASASGQGSYIPQLIESRIYQETVRINAERKAKLQDTIRDIERQISAAETERAKLLVKYTPEYLPVKVVDEQIAKLKEDRDKTEKAVTQIIENDQSKIEKNAVSGALISLRSQLESAQTQENQLRATYLSEMARTNLQGIAQTQLTTKKREIETNRGLLDGYIQQQKARELAISSSQPDNLKISTYATTPDTPVGPNRTRNIFIALLMSLAAGIGLAFLLDYLDDSIKNSDDIGKNLGLPTLAIIPFTNSAEKRRLNALTGDNSPENHSLALIATGDNRSAMVEAYRHLRTSLLFSSAGKPPQTILVTSAQPAEGKTTTAINTAITLAQSGGEVLIIDCDLRRPRLHKQFGVSNAHGLTSYLSNDKNPDSLIQTYKELPNLKVITSGPIPPNPAELLSSAEMKNLLQYLKGTYKHIVIDSPPAIFFTDAAILSMIVDGVVLVTLAGKSSIYLTRRFKQRLGSIGARIYGVVLNGIRSNSMEYGYYGYGYSDYYTSDAEEEAPAFEEEDDDEMFSTVGRKR